MEETISTATKLVSFPRKIYLASSWRNTEYPAVLQALRDAGHAVYDFRSSNGAGFSWKEVDDSKPWTDWTPEEFIENLKHPASQKGFKPDKGGLDWCDTCLLLLPCGRSAHTEAGYACGQGKDTFFLLREDRFEPELMYLLGHGCFTALDKLQERLADPRRGA